MTTMAACRMFPLQSSRGVAGPTNIPWSIAEKAYSVYRDRFGSGQTLERLAERGGFDLNEMDEFHPKWREEFSAIEAGHAELARLRRDVWALRKAAQAGLDRIASDVETEGHTASDGDFIRKVLAETAPISTEA